MVSRVVNILRMREIPILHQLRLEEALLRLDSRNWCLINDGTPQSDPPAIVMGISGKPRLLVNVDRALGDKVPVIKRYSGGGTVIVDDDTIFMSLIFNTNSVPGTPCFPREIMNWTEKFYLPAFNSSSKGDFNLREHDYVFGSRKFGGNAQCITKSRWVHHTSFLWDFKAANMQYLKFPPKSPEYREGRSHTDFLCAVRDSVDLRRGEFVDRLASCIEEAGFEPVHATLEEVSHLLEGDYLKSTKLVDLNNLPQESPRP